MAARALGLIAALLLAACGSEPADYRGEHPPRHVPVDATAVKPRLALVLGSGGRRGFAHVGVLRALDAAGVCPDLIVGTSVGAIVGALYAAGASVTDIERLAGEIAVFRFAELTLSKHGWFKGKAIEEVVNRAVQGRRIEQFPKAFAAAATRTPEGTLTLFNRGDAGAAVRASAAVPGTLLPLRIQGAIYLDGDIASPVPVLAARALGAATVMAVDISADLATTPALDQIPGEWVSQGITRRKLIDFELPQASIVVRPRLPYFAGESLEYRAAAMRAGEDAARDALALYRNQGNPPLPACPGPRPTK